MSEIAEGDADRVNPYLRFEGMAWPDPTDPNGTAWRLRCGQPNRQDLMFAASVMGAYAHLIDLPQQTRNRRVSQIRAHAAATTPAETTEAGQ